MTNLCITEKHIHMNADEISRAPYLEIDHFNDFFKGTKQTSTVIKVIDGDTFWGTISVLGRIYKLKMRLIGINAPELHPLLTDPDRLQIQQEAKHALSFLQTLMPEHCTCTLDCDCLDSFGRLLCTVTTEHSLNVNQKMVEAGYAVATDCSKPMTWTDMWILLQEHQAKYNSGIGT